MSQNLKTNLEDLKYFEGKPVIERIERASRSSLRQYRGVNDLPKVEAILEIILDFFQNPTDHRHMLFLRQTCIFALDGCLRTQLLVRGLPGLRTPPASPRRPT